MFINKSWNGLNNICGKNIALFRTNLGISQRELAKLTGISRSTLNDLINGKIKKVDMDDLRRIAEVLDLSLEELLQIAGYNEMLLYFSRDKYVGKSSKDLKKLLEQYKSSQTELLTFDSKKRDKARDIGFKLFDATEKLKWIKDGKEGFTLDQIIKELTDAQELLNSIMNKYDYSKLPKE